ERRLPGRLRRRLGSGDGLARRRAAPLAPSPRRLRRGKRVAPTRPVLRQSARGPPRGRLIVGWRGVPSRWRLRRPSRGLAAPARGPRGGRLRRAPARQVLWPSGRRRRHLIRTKIIGSDRDTLLLGGAQISEPTQLLPADLRRGLPLGAAAPPPPHLAPNVPPLLATLLGPIRTARSHCCPCPAGVRPRPSVRPLAASGRWSLCATAAPPLPPADRPAPEACWPRTMRRSTGSRAATARSAPWSLGW